MLSTLQLTDLVVYLLIAVLYVPVIVRAIRGQDGHQPVHFLLGLYVFGGLLLALGEAFWRGGLTGTISEATFQVYQSYAALLLSIVMLLVVTVFLRRQGWTWLILAGILMVVLILITQDVFDLPEIIWTVGEWSMTRADLPQYLILLGWLIFNLIALIAVRTAHQRSNQPLYRNRLKYWWPFFLLIILNDVMIFSNNSLAGNPLRLAATWLIGFVVLTHNMPDVRQILRSTLIYVITTLLIVVFYISGFALSQTLFRAVPNFNPLVVGAIIALVLATLFSPLLGFVRRWVDSWLNLEQFDASRTLQEYGEAISNILEMQRLASIAVGLIIESLSLTRGFLFLVDQDTDQDERKTYYLRAVRNPGERRIKVGIILETSPIINYFTREQRPLLQYDMDLLPSYNSLTRPEREWFIATKSEVYVPIIAKRRWIGLLAFGPKLSGNRYTDQDLITLSALANQTAVALENARLVDNLMNLNQELRQAYQSLDKANRDLERLDRTKSDFISIASNELSTPLKAMRGYIEMLVKDPNQSPSFQTALQGLHDGTTRLNEIVDSMFDVSQIDASNKQLNLEPIDLAELVREVCFSLAQDFAGRNQSLALELPALPYIKADPNSLQKLFYHLVTNAIKFTPNDGKITISGQIVPTGNEFIPRGGIQITVSDTGVGIAPEYHELIFTKFYQPGELGHQSTSNSGFKGRGVGLGLALSKGIVEAHGGHIWVQSPGYDAVHFPGSKFHVILPTHKAEANERIDMGREINMTL